MSAGVFLRSSYRTRSGSIHPFRVQPETLQAVFGAVTNAAPTGALTSGISVKKGPTRRKRGAYARGVYFEWQGTPPAGYDANSVGTISVPDELVWDSILPSSDGTYLGASITVIGKYEERIA